MFLHSTQYQLRYFSQFMQDNICVMKLCLRAKPAYQVAECLIFTVCAWICKKNPKTRHWGFSWTIFLEANLFFYWWLLVQITHDSLISL